MTDRTPAHEVLRQRRTAALALNYEVAAVRVRLAAIKLQYVLERKAAALEARFNPYHDEAGRFTTADGVGSGGSSRNRGVQRAGLVDGLLRAGVGLAKLLTKKAIQGLKSMGKKAIAAIRRPRNFEKLPSYLKPRRGVGQIGRAHV